MRVSGNNFRPEPKPFYPPAPIIPLAPEPREIVIPAPNVSLQIPEGKPAEVNVIVEKQKGWRFNISYRRDGRIEEVIATPLE